MNILSKILSSRVRADIFRLLFNGHMQELHIRAIERQSCVTFNSIRQELKKLSALDLVAGRRDGNRLYYKANTNHPLYSTLSDLVAKTVGYNALLTQALSVPDIEIAFVFGSLAGNEEQDASDIDLFIIGDITLRKLSSLLSGLEEQTGREINPHIFSATEFKKRRDAEDHLIVQVLTGDKIFVIGTEHELGKI